VRQRGYLKTVPLLLAAAVWPATALGGNPHGTPPGQQKKETGSTNAHVSVHAHAKAKAHGHVHASGSAKVHAAVHTHASAGAGAQAGVKSSSSSSENTYAAAASNQTKLYGNGQTAGQIAMTNGAQANAVLYGPGNSQPHKMSCGAHWIDVHALKAHAGACAGAAAAANAGASAQAGVKASASSGFNTFASATSNQTKLYGNGQTAGQIAIQAGFGAAILFGPGNSQPHKVACGAHLIDVHALKAHAGACAGAMGAEQASTSASSQAQAAAQVQAAVQAQSHAGVAAKSSGGGVLGASATSPTNRSTGAGAVLGATARSGTLPFTGLSLLGALALGLALLLGGFGLRRLVRTHS
jgi:hypothetical protein